MKAVGWLWGEDNPRIGPTGNITGGLGANDWYPAELHLDHGMSGGPVIDLDSGAVVGLVAGGEKTRGITTFVMPLFQASELLQYAGIDCRWGATVIRPATAERLTQAPVEKTATIVDADIVAALARGSNAGDDKQLRDELARTAERLATTEPVLEAILGRLQGVPLEELPARISEMVERQRSLEARLAVTSTEGREQEALLDQAKAAVGKAQYERADGILAELDTSQMADVAAADAAADQVRLKAAATRAERGEVSFLRADYEAAAKLFASAAELVPRSKDDARLSYQERQGEALYRQGHERNSIEALRRSANVFRAMLDTPIGTLSPANRTATEANLALVLGEVGKRSDDLNVLGDAVNVLRSSLDRLSPSQEPRLRATTEVNLSRALQTLGSLEKTTEHLREAVDVARKGRNALPVADDPLPWLELQYAMADGLQSWGWRANELENNQEATQFLGEAVEAYSDTIIRTPASLNRPAWSASVRTRLGAALQATGFLKRDPGPLRQALDIYGIAVLDLSRKQDPEQWTDVQRRRGETLEALGWLLTRQGNAADGQSSFSAAAATYNDILAGLSKSRWPIVWADTQYKLGKILHLIGQAESDIEKLNAAADALESSLEVFTRTEDKLVWADTAVELGKTRRTLGWRYAEAGQNLAAEEQLSRSIKIFQDALIVREKDRWPDKWASSQADLALANYWLARVTSDTRALDSAVAAYQEAMSVRTEEQDREDWASLQSGLATVWWEKGKLTHDKDALLRARDAFVEAQRAFQQAGKSADALGLDGAVASVTGEIAELSR